MADYESLRIRKLADRSEGERVPGFDSFTGVQTLVNPETGAAEPWPLLGVQVEGKLPKRVRVPTSFVANGKAEGWLALEGERIEHRPSGPPEELWRTPAHTFVHVDVIVLKTVDGDVRYRVVHQPDKYVVDGADDDAVTDDVYAKGETRVDWFYDLELEG